MTPGHRLWETLQRRPLLADTVLAVGLYGCEMLLWVLAPRQVWPQSWPVALVYSALGVVPIALRRRWFWPAVILLSLHSTIPYIGFASLADQGFALVVLTYTAAAHRRAKPAALATLLIWGPALTAATLLMTPAAAPLDIAPPYLLVFNVMVALLCFLFGRAVYNHRAFTEALRVRAQAAEENQHWIAEQAVADERRRIARELHDVVAHHVSVMGVLATGARRVLRRDPDAADEALATIEETGRTTLREMRRLLTVLRTEAEPAAELTPQPGLTGITQLVDQLREAGLPVTLTVTGDPGAIDPGIALTLYRIVQEALTNTLKHAGDAVAKVHLAFADGHLTLDISDTGRGPRPDNRLGHGLLGMRERVALYGGTLRTGPRAGGGFRVSARIPAA
ncbi:MAG TPA: sensor histidine kinase [Micromonosporaceae bacterium]|nr:sensor histidine kinase [Micromonosporaceae bacterium]